MPEPGKRAFRFWGTIVTSVALGLGLIGVLIVLWPQPQSVPPPKALPSVQNEPHPKPSPSVQSEPSEIVSPDLPVKKYELLTSLRYRFPTTLNEQVEPGSSKVKFSVFVNNVQVGVYSPTEKKAEINISRFIKPGPNNIRITWTADSDMTRGYVAELRMLGVLQDGRLTNVISRDVNRTTQAGEAVTTIIHRGDAPR